MSIIATAIPRITSDFHSLNDVGWYGSGFFLGLTAFAAFWGKGYKYLTMSWTFMASIAVFELGSLLCAVSPSSATFIFGRAIQGAGGAGVTSGCYTIIGFIVRPAKVPLCIGILGAIFSLANVGGPLLGGLFTQHLTWRWCFYINLPFGGIALAIIFIFLREYTPRASKSLPIRKLVVTFDFPGIFLTVAALVCLNLFLQWGGITKPWNSGSIIGPIMALIVLGFFWGYVQWKAGENAMVVPRVLKDPNIAICGAFTFLANISSFSRVYNLPIYFQTVDGVSPSESGIRILGSILSISLFTLLGSAAIGKLGHYPYFLLCGSILTTIGGSLIRLLQINSPAAQYIGFQVVAGAGVGLTLQVPVIVVQSKIQKSDVSVAMATVLFFQFLGAAYGVASAQSIMTNRLLSVLRTNAPDVTPQQVLGVGAYGLKNAFSATQLPGVLDSYMVALRDTWMFSVAISAVKVVIAIIAIWWEMRSTRSEKKSLPEEGIEK